MKKFFTTIVAVLMACCCFLFSGCNEKGTYYFHSLKIEENETTYTFNIGDKREGIEFQKESYILCLEEDGKCTMIQNEKSETSKTERSYLYEGIWKKLDGKIYIQIDDRGSAFVGTKDGNTLTLTLNDTTLTLKK